MHTTKFRGQILDGPRKGEWVYGYYLYSEVEEIHYIATSAFEHGFTEVDPNTVGQYIGLSDKNEKEIYAGDILEFSSFEQGAERYQVIYSGYKFMLYGFTQQIGDIYLFSIVIGNIHDNPDLLTQ